MHSILSGLIPGRFFGLIVYWYMEYLSTAMCQKIGNKDVLFWLLSSCRKFLFLVKIRFFKVMKGFYLYIFRSEVDAFVQCRRESRSTEQTC